MFRTYLWCLVQKELQSWSGKRSHISCWFHPFFVWTTKWTTSWPFYSSLLCLIFGPPKEPSDWLVYSTLFFDNLYHQVDLQFGTPVWPPTGPLVGPKIGPPVQFGPPVRNTIWTTIWTTSLDHYLQRGLVICGKKLHADILKRKLWPSCFGHLVVGVTLHGILWSITHFSDKSNNFFSDIIIKDNSWSFFSPINISTIVFVTEYTFIR